MMQPIKKALRIGRFGARAVPEREVSTSIYATCQQDHFSFFDLAPFVFAVPRSSFERFLRCLPADQNRLVSLKIATNPSILYPRGTEKKKEK